MFWWETHLYVLFSICDYMNCTRALTGQLPAVLLSDDNKTTCINRVPLVDLLKSVRSRRRLLFRLIKNNRIHVTGDLFHQFPVHFIMWEPDGTLEVHLTFSRRWVMRGEGGFWLGRWGDPVCHLSYSVVSLKLINAAYVPHFKRAPNAGSSQRVPASKKHLYLCAHTHTHILNKGIP